MPRRRYACERFALVCVFLGLVPLVVADDPKPVEVRFLNSSVKSDVDVQVDRGKLRVSWPIAENEFGRLTLRLVPGGPLIESLGIATDRSRDHAPIVKDADPAVFVTVGSREQGKNRPPAMSVFNEFFDNPARRPSTVHAGQLTLKHATVARHGRRTTISVGDVQAGPFRGEWRITVFPGSRLVQVQAVVETKADRVAFLYDAGLVWTPSGDHHLAWTDTEGNYHPESLPPSSADRSIAVRHRAAALGDENGSLVVSPPPHQFFFPRDYTDNVHTIWAGRDHLKQEARFGLGIRQDATGGGGFVPWFNAPPGTKQHLGMFLLLSRARPAAALAEMREYTRSDTFADLPGRITFTSHYHMAITMAAMNAKTNAANAQPEFVKMFKDMNVQAVHLGEFHGDGHQFDPGPLRLAELKAEFDECRRRSDAELLMIPGEEISKFLGKIAPGRESGHWMSLFPHPVYWILDRKPGEPFVEEDPKYGKIYRVGNAEDVQRVIEAEHGLVWTAHPRIKSSSWAPDAFLSEPYYRADTWLGGAWKAMPADLSLPRLGVRGLDLLDDMANWGGKKYLPGEVDVFKLDHTHELYGHMNINYLKLDRLPTFEGGWHPILDALRGGKFFTTTGEVLIRDFTVGGVESGGTLTKDEKLELKAEIEWTYPPRFAEVISGDGEKVYRERLDLDEFGAFGKTALRLSPALKGRKWVRLEVWDVAANGAYTQPVWIEPRTD